MKKRNGRIFLTMVIAAGLLSGCGSGEGSKDVNDKLPPIQDTSVSTEKNAGEDEAASFSTTEKENNTEATEEAKMDISWAVNPTIEADMIIVDGTEQESRSVYSAVIRKNDKYGFIRYNGEIAVEPCFTECFDNYFLFDEEENGRESTSARINEEGILKLTREQLGFGGWDGGYLYYYLPEDLSVFDMYMGTQQYLEEKPVIVELGHESEDSEHFSITGEEKFGVACGKGLLIDCKYEDGYSSMVESSQFLALKKDGKWGYFAPNGKPITDFVYDAAPGHLQEDCRTHLENVEYREHEVPYLATDGYIAGYAGGKGGYIDTEGNEIYPVGTFEEVCPVHGGKAWAKYEGKWGVLELPEKEVKAMSASDGDYVKLREDYDDFMVYKELLDAYGMAYWNAVNSMYDSLEDFQQKYSTEYPQSRFGAPSELVPYYAIYDLNNDGTKELFIEACGSLYNIYTIVNGNPTSILTDDFLSIGWYGTMTVCEDGYVQYSISERYFEHEGAGMGWYQLPKGGGSLKKMDGASFKIDNWPSDDLIYTYYDNDGHVITEDEYDAEFRKHNAITLNYKKIPQ